MLIASLSNVLYTYFVSKLGADAIAAVSLAFPISLLATTAMGGGIGAGTASAVARSLGARHRREAASVAEHGLLLALGLGAVFGAAMIPGSRIVFGWMGGHGEVLEQAIAFGRVLFGGIIITFTSAMLDSILRGEGNVRVSSIWSSTSLALQIVLTPLFIFTGGMGLVGAAAAMLAGQLIAIVPRCIHMFGARGLLREATWPPSIATARFRDILRVGIPASLSTIISNLGVMVLTGVLARLGNSHLAAYGLGTRLDFLFLSLAYGFGAAVITLVGLATGAKRPELVRGYVRRTAALIVAVLAVPSAILWWKPGLWLGLFTEDAEILAVGTQYLRIIGPSYPLVGVSMLLAFAFQGLGRATGPLVVMLIRTIAVLVVSIVCTRWLGLGDRAVFAVVAIGNVASAAVMALLFARLLASGRIGRDQKL